MGLSARGSTATPPLPPPKGRSASAHFQLIQMASAAISLMSTLGAKRVPPLAGPKRQMMLDPVSDEDLGPIVFHPDRTGDDDRALGIEEPVAFVLGDAQMVGDDRELIAGHFEHRAGKEAAVHIAFSRPPSPRTSAMIAGAGPRGTEIRVKEWPTAGSAARAARPRCGLTSRRCLTILPAKSRPATFAGFFGASGAPSR